MIHITLTFVIVPQKIRVVTLNVLLFFLKTKNSQFQVFKISIFDVYVNEIVVFTNLVCIWD